MKRITLVCGHYGSGKTNFALNLAVNAAKSGEKITLVDLDIVNPYFRTADYKDELEAAGVNVIAQNLEGTTLDAPALTARMFSIFEESMGRVIVDVGGDDAGATALGRFSRQLNESGYDMLCVVNKFRKFISSPDEAVGLLGEIEAACRLKATGLVTRTWGRRRLRRTFFRPSLMPRKRLSLLVCRSYIQLRRRVSRASSRGR